MKFIAASGIIDAAGGGGNHIRPEGSGRPAPARGRDMETGADAGTKGPGPGGPGKAEAKIGKDIDVLARFIDIYCRKNHPAAARETPAAKGPLAGYLARSPLLCPECGKLLLHAASKRLICPYDPKPRCKKCPTHCYRADYRDAIRRVMRFSGMELLKTGRLDLLYKYFF